MKKLLFATFLSLLFSVTIAYKTPSLTKDAALAQIMREYPDAVPESAETNSREEETGRKQCESIGYYDPSTNCSGIYTVCHHHFLFWNWTTYSDQTVGCI